MVQTKNAKRGQQRSKATHCNPESGNLCSSSTPRECGLMGPQWGRHPLATSPSCHETSASCSTCVAIICCPPAAARSPHCFHRSWGCSACSSQRCSASASRRSTLRPGCMCSSHQLARQPPHRTEATDELPAQVSACRGTSAASPALVLLLQDQPQSTRPAR